MAWTSEGFVIRLWPPLNPPRLLHLRACLPTSADHTPHWWTSPQAPVPSFFPSFPQAGAPFSLYSSSKAQLTPTSSLGLPSRTSPQHWPSWHHDAHTVVSTVCCACHSLLYNRLWTLEIKGLCPIYPQPPQSTTQELLYKMQCFPSAKILISRFPTLRSSSFSSPPCACTGCDHKDESFGGANSSMQEQLLPLKS